MIRDGWINYVDGVVRAEAWGRHHALNPGQKPEQQNQMLLSILHRRFSDLRIQGFSNVSVMMKTMIGRVASISSPFSGKSAPWPVGR
jgi:hypothetical protein